MEPQDVEIIDLTTLSTASSGSPTREYDREISEDASVPWYQDPNASHPFSLSAKGRATRPYTFPFTEVEFFPWGDTPLEHLWNGEVYSPDDDPQSTWLRSIVKWRNTVSVCGGRFVRLINTSPRQQGSPLFQVALPTDCRSSVSHVKWALNPWNLHPLLIYVHSSVLHIFDVETRSLLGCIRGHGGDITSLGVHPLHPHLVFTTSRDCTTRIYDLRYVIEVEREPELSSRRKSAFGIRIDHREGDCCIGRCVVILTGGRSGGHEAAVLGAEFHPSLPLIATCGLDHALRIWHLKPQLFFKAGPSSLDTHTVDREDKPLFSSTMIHDARILSVHWLSHDLLLSHSAPRIARINGDPAEGDSGTLAVWQWLSIGRFFPPDVSIYREPSLRGCISDYRESSSFKMISISRLPVETSRISVYRHSHRPPLILLLVRNKIVLLNSSHLPPRNRPVLQDDRDREEHGEARRPAKRIRLAREASENTNTEVEGWTLSVALGEDLEDEEVEGCAMSPDGQKVAAVGASEGVWIWDER